MALKPGTVTIDCVDPRTLAAVWTGAAGYRVAADHGSFTGRNRVHIDYHAEDREAEVERLVGLGATVLDEQQVPGLRWTVLADPEGNEFCVAG
jgi:predicted enzyme related to lactoylglutathione lyase